ncbi:hypothetical protein NBRC10512_000618 [Rhodotorula toruloides]|uniref:RHTO0S01e05776g1_1 n=2 Tax=Rhodotorula toruloides TaxID=5286 RepID=A0A061ADT2_RHOTO|nr:uncharacterized protein RHTO_01431 [Rhodotorula toruloides NP11]EMS21784.1 hypothetical protein RHTO_01431 [Rhodotorula toruloides NP11]KAJ8292253.1 hypothetical protein OF846_004566 [Rhodotorula toruloides]CDR35727.1 RHTO0S01e05776g1_1 [Rhodotorula toruloides]
MHTPARSGTAGPSLPPSAPRPASLVDIRSRHSMQCSTAVTISAFATLLADLNSSWEEDGRTGKESSRQDRVDLFREEWLMGMLSRFKPLELLLDGEEETYSDGTRRSSAAASTSTLPSILTATTHDSPNADAESPDPLSDEARQRFVPLDAISRGVLAEQTIKRSLKQRGQLLRHKDFASLPAVARKAMQQTRKTGKPVYVSPGLLDSVEWTEEYVQRKWAAPGIRFGVFRPDLIRFEEVKRKGEEGERLVLWEVVEVKYSGKSRGFIYTNFKVQAGFYHLTLTRLLSAVPSLIPSHKLTFFISRDPLSSSYEEQSLALRTVQAFVEHHLFVLLPGWLNAVKVDEWERLQKALKEQPPSTPARSGAVTQTFIEKLQASAKSAPPTPGRARRKATSLSKADTFSSLTKPSQLSQPLPPPDSPNSPSTSPSRSSLLALPEDSPTPAHYNLPSLPPLPPVDEQEQRELEELFERIVLGES